MGPTLVTTHRPTSPAMITTPVGPTFVKNNGQSGARSGDHTHVGEGLGDGLDALVVGVAWQALASAARETPTASSRGGARNAMV